MFTWGEPVYISGTEFATVRGRALMKNYTEEDKVKILFLSENLGSHSTSCELI
jgi:hypothetical protein